MRYMRLAQHRQQLRQSSTVELERMLLDEEKNLFMSRRDSATKQLDNPMRIRQIRKNVARIRTILRERELESAKGKE